MEFGIVVELFSFQPAVFVCSFCGAIAKDLSKKIRIMSLIKERFNIFL
jgi:hypothetical protein